MYWRNILDKLEAGHKACDIVNNGIWIYLEAILNEIKL